MKPNSNRKDSPINRIQNALIERYIEETNKVLNEAIAYIEEDIEKCIPIKFEKKSRGKEEK